jgi:hypothetical protein
MSIPAHGGIVKDTFTIPRERGVKMLVLIVVLCRLCLVVQFGGALACGKGCGFGCNGGFQN